MISRPRAPKARALRLSYTPIREQFFDYAQVIGAPGED